MMTANSFMPYNGQLFFYGYDGLNEGLWKTDGTTAGTVFVKSLNGGSINFQTVPIISNNILYFNVFATLWRTDGTPSGTFALTSGINVLEKVDLNGTLIFMGEEAGVSGNELWKTDGTVHGTSRIIDFLPGSSPGVSSYGKVSLVAQGNFVYFLGNPTSSQGTYLCKTNGTAAGTQVVDNSMIITAGLYSFQNKIFTVGFKLIDISPTCGAATIYKIIQINNGVVSDFWLPPTYNSEECGPFYNGDLGGIGIYFRRTQNNLFFLAQNYLNLIGNSPTVELRKIDGNTASLVKNFPYSYNAGGPDPFAFQMPSDDNFFENTFYFQGNEEATGYEAWRSDGTEAGTFLLKDITVGTTGSDPFEFRTINGITYFVASGSTGRKLYQTDGTNAGTVEVADPNSLLLYPNSTNQNNTSINQINYFSNKLSSKLIFVGTSNANGNPSALFSVCTPPITPTIVSSLGSPICEGQSTTLTSTCIGNATWNTGATTSSIAVSPNTDTNYTVTCTNSCGTSPAGSFYMRISPLPTIPTFVTRLVTICPGNSVQLLAANCNGAMQWSNGAAGTPLIASEVGVYTATCTNSCGTSLASHTFTVRNPDIIENLTGTSAFGPTNAIQTINSTQTVSTGYNSTYKASRSITLSPNFTANAGSIFKAEIGAACQITNGLLASYNFNNNTLDQSGNGRNATFANTFIADGRKGDPNSAWSFNGSNQRINLGTWFNLQTFTISMWLKTGSTQANAYAMIIDNNHGGNLMWNMQQRNTTLNLYDFGLSGSPGTGQEVNLTPNQWTHVVITCNGSALSLYKNGVLSGSSNYTGPIIYNGTQSLCLGAYVNGGNYVRYWNGLMDDIKIYNRALSAVEVSYLNAE